MTAAFAQPVQRGVEIIVPLNRLKKSPRNARRTPHAPADVETLAASIAAKGVLQPPVVEAARDAEGQPTGAYLVTIGEGRRLALSLLAKRKRISKTEPIRCLLDEDNDAFEVSLDENVTRFAMHPADQFEAFRDLAEQKGWGAEEIGARFGVSAQIVRQRLRLGAISPALMAAYRSGDLTLDQLMAFAVSEDHARQEQVYAGLSYNRSASLIRRLMTEHEVEAGDRRAVFVGAEAYEAAGGRVRRDLFAEDRGGWFEDVGLLDRLALEKLAAQAETVRAQEGWRWAEGHLDYPRDHGFRRVYPEAVRHDAGTEARLTALAEEYDGLIATAEDEALSDEAEARLQAIDAELQAASRADYAPEAYGRAGLFAILDWNGTVRIERGFVRPEHETPSPEPEPQDPDADAPPPAGGALPSPKVKPLPDRLVSDLTAHRTAALRDALATHPGLAVLAALHALVLQTFYQGCEDSCLDLRATTLGLHGFAEQYFESVAGKAIEGRHELWGTRLPEAPDALWDTLAGFSADERATLFAHCVSLTVNAVHGIGRPRLRLAHADLLASHLNLDLRTYWQATAESFFGRISKAQVLDAVCDGASPEAAGRIEGLKKDDMARAAADLLGAQGWLPPLLRPAAATPA